MSNKLSVKERHISFAAQLKNLRTGREKIDLKKNKPRYRCACINITVFLGADNRARTHWNGFFIRFCSKNSVKRWFLIELRSVFGVCRGV